MWKIDDIFCSKGFFGSVAAVNIEEKFKPSLKMKETSEKFRSKFTSPEVAQGRHPVEAGKYQYVQSYCIEKRKGSRIPERSNVSWDKVIFKLRHLRQRGIRNTIGLIMQISSCKHEAKKFSAGDKRLLVFLNV